MAGKALPKGKFDGVDTGELFSVPAQRSTADGGEKQKKPKTARGGICPGHASTRPTALLVVNDHLMWPAHDKTLGSGAKQPCWTSGVRLCDAPALTVEQNQFVKHTPTCTCQK